MLVLQARLGGGIERVGLHSGELRGADRVERHGQRRLERGGLGERAVLDTCGSMVADSYWVVRKGEVRKKLSIWSESSSNLMTCEAPAACEGAVSSDELGSPNTSAGDSAVSSSGGLAVPRCESAEGAARADALGRGAGCRATAATVTSDVEAVLLLLLLRRRRRRRRRRCRDRSSRCGDDRGSRWRRGRLGGLVLEEAVKVVADVPVEERLARLSASLAELYGEVVAEEDFGRRAGRRRRLVLVEADLAHVERRCDGRGGSGCVVGGGGSGSSARRRLEGGRGRHLDEVVKAGEASVASDLGGGHDASCVDSQAGEAVFECRYAVAAVIDGYDDVGDTEASGGAGIGGGGRDALVHCAVLCCAVLCFFLPLLWQAGGARHRSAELRAGRIPARLFRRTLLPLSIFVAELQRGGARFASFAPIPRSPLTPHQSLDSRVRSLSPVTNFLRLRTSAQLSIARSGSAQAPAQLGPLFLARSFCRCGNGNGNGNIWRCPFPDFIRPPLPRHRLGLLGAPVQDGVSCIAIDPSSSPPGQGGSPFSLRMSPSACQHVTAHGSSAERRLRVHSSGSSLGQFSSSVACERSLSAFNHVVTPPASGPEPEISGDAKQDERKPPDARVRRSGAAVKSHFLRCRASEVISCLPRSERRSQTRTTSKAFFVVCPPSPSAIKR
ncbi:hypothetical protein L1887_49668 [Cichorium endivia]|nr:hypothetical protein L1887_49668 [Cichorium endivia]